MSQVIATHKNHRVGFWDGSLGYSQATVSVLMSLVIGGVLHVFVGYASQPTGMAVLAGTSLFVMLVFGRVSRTNRVIHWLTGIPFAVTATAAVGFLALLGGILPQSLLSAKFGVPSMFGSWPFLILLWLMLLNLVGSVGKRSWPLNYTNIVYLSSHAGLAIAIIGGGVSALTLERLTLVLFEGVPSSTAQNASGEDVKLPFSATLREFQLETFPPTLAWAQADESKESGLRIVPGEMFIKPGGSETLNGVSITVEKYLPRAVQTGDQWREVPWKTAAPAAFVRAKTQDGKLHEGWVSCGSIETSGALLSLNERTAIVMPEPRPKKFRSDFDVTQGGNKKSLSVEVNKKATLGGYDLYQLSYDEKMGAASQYSVLEVVRDRGLPVVYLGIFLMLFGCCLHLGNGLGGRR